MKYENSRKLISALYNKLNNIEEKLSQYKDQISKQYTEILMLDEMIAEGALDGLESINEALDGMSFSDKCFLLAEVKKDLNDLVAKRQEVKKPLTSQVARIDKIFKPVTRSLENIDKRCEESLLSEVQSNPDQYADENGDVRIEGSTYILQEQPKCRKYHITDLNVVSKDFLMIDEGAVQEYYDTLGMLPDGIGVTVERSFTIKAKKTSSK